MPYPPESLTSGKDGALWYSELASTGIVGDSKKARKGFIGRITTAGAASEVPIDPNTSTFEIAAGSDGAIWYVAREGDGRTLSRVTASGGVKNFATPANTYISLIVAGPGVLWIVDATNTIWRFNVPK